LKLKSLIQIPHSAFNFIKYHLMMQLQYTRELHHRQS